MPITTELENVKKFESVRFTHEQAEVLPEIHEGTAQNAINELKEFIRSELKELRSEINSLELRIKASQSDLLIKIFGIVFGCSTLAAAILKLIL